MSQRERSARSTGSRAGAGGELETAWRSHRGRLLDIGYRLLGRISEAEDVADEAYARLVAADRASIDDLEGWLVAVTGRLCIDRLRSADLRRRAYVGPWLPEPIVGLADPAAVDPGDRVTLDDSVRMALLVVLEQLSPAERTSFVLHDLFAVPYEDVAEIVGRSPAACRQLASRARRRLRTDPERPRIDVDREELTVVAERFAAACAAGGVEPLLEVLDPEVVGDFDSGGQVAGAPLHAVSGAEPIARILANAFRGASFGFGVAEVNGEPGVIVETSGMITAVIAIGGVRDGRIDLLHGVGNPDKLAHLRTGG